MKKLMFYINAIHHGGAERVMVNLAKQFCSRGYDVVFVTSFKADWEYHLDNKIKRITLSAKNDEAFFKKNIHRIFLLRKVLKSEKPDVLISFMAEPNFRALFATIGIETKNIISIRNDPEREYPNFLYKFLAKTLYTKAHHVIFQTEDAKQWFPQNIQQKSTIIFNPVDEHFFCYEEDLIVERKGIYSTGRLVAQKNHKLLINAFSKISEYVKEDLYIYGEGELKKELNNYIKELKLQERVHLMGASDKVEEDIKNAKIFVLSSNFEGCPNSLMEALALGIPSISTDCPCGGPKMLSENGGCVLVPCNDANKLAEAILKVYNNDDYAVELTQRAIETAKVFKTDKVVNDWVRCVESV